MSRRSWLGSSLVAATSVLLEGCSPSRNLPTVTPNASGPRAPIQLALNENPFGPSPLAIRAIEEQLGAVARYTSEEADSLSRQIAALEQVPGDQVVLGEVLEALGSYLVQESGAAKEIAYSTPGYTVLGDAARAAGGAAVSVALDARLENDLAALGAHVGQATRALFLVNPHNPSGTVSDAAAFHAFVREMAQRTLVIVDEAYLEFVDDFAARTCVAHTRSGENVVVFRTFSKIYGLAGLPFGYAIAPAPLAQALKARGVGHPRSLNRLAVVAASASLRDTAFLAVVRAKVARERTRWSRVLDSLGLRHTDARGNFVFFESGRPHAELAAAMRARGVEIGRSFPPLEGWTRISVGLPEENALAQSILRDVLHPNASELRR